MKATKPTIATFQIEDDEFVAVKKAATKRRVSVSLWLREAARAKLARESRRKVLA